VPSLASEAIDRATDLDFGAHKKTGHKRSTTTRRAIRPRRRPISAWPRKSRKAASISAWRCKTTSSWVPERSWACGPSASS